MQVGGYHRLEEELNGEDYRNHPLEKRKAKLEKILSRTQGMRFSEHLDGDGASIFQARLQNGIGRHRFEAAGFSLSKRSMQKLGQAQKSYVSSGAANPGWELVS
jgi:hypothetical protein